ncbi:acyl-CoA N-acyltransferase [Xylariaceae sp. FL1272]|nr:acyl-CoA N-acyltransferase [Xylariaceae sp. FL1272]
MPLAVLPAHICDVEEIFDVYFAAFEHEPILGFLFPGGVDRKAHTAGTVQWWNHDSNGYSLKCVDTDTGKIVGMAQFDIFWKPGEENAWKKPEGALWLEGKDREKAESVLCPLWNMHEELWKKSRHIYIPTMAVHPDHQRKGIGRLLLQWGIDIAEKLGVPIYTESTVGGFPLYKAGGFEQLTHVHLIHKAEVLGAKEDSEVPLVVRMPSRAKGLTFKEWAERGYPEAYE